VNNLPRVVTQPRPGRESNSRPLDRKFDALPLRHHATGREERRGPTYKGDGREGREERGDRKGGEAESR